MSDTPKYSVLTYDWNLQKFTPQDGVSPGPYSQFELRRALRALRKLGYDVTRHGGFCVLVEKVKEASK